MAHYEDITIDQGTDVSIRIELENPDGTAKDLSGYSVSAQIKRSFASSDSDAIDFLTQLDSSAVIISLTNSQTSLLNSPTIPNRYVYDVELVDSDSNIERILEGRLDVNPSV